MALASTSSRLTRVKSLNCCTVEAQGARGCACAAWCQRAVLDWVNPHIVHLVAVSVPQPDAFKYKRPNRHRNRQIAWRSSQSSSQKIQPLKRRKTRAGQFYLYRLNSSLKVRLCVLMEEIREGTCFLHSIQGDAYCQRAFIFYFSHEWFMPQLLCAAAPFRGSAMRRVQVFPLAQWLVNTSLLYG